MPASMRDRPGRWRHGEGSVTIAGMRIQSLFSWLVAAAWCLIGAPGAQAACTDVPAASVDWSGCEKHRLILRKVNLQGARLVGADLNGTDLEAANLAGADLSRASVDRVRLAGADLSRAVMVQLSGYRSNFSKSRLIGADLTKAELARSNFAGADFSGANLSKAEFQRASLEGAVLLRANLTGADLARAKLSGAKLANARMAQVRMFRTRVEGADLSATVGLTQVQVDSACGDKQTILPKGIKTSSSWPCNTDE